MCVCACGCGFLSPKSPMMNPQSLSLSCWHCGFLGQDRKALSKCLSLTKSFGPKVSSTQAQLRDEGLGHLGSGS